MPTVPTQKTNKQTLIKRSFISIFLLLRWMEIKGVGEETNNLFIFIPLHHLNSIANLIRLFVRNVVTCEPRSCTVSAHAQHQSAAYYFLQISCQTIFYSFKHFFPPQPQPQHYFLQPQPQLVCLSF